MRAYRADGHGRAAYEPAMMVALLLYAYARGMRSSRAIERACEEDVAYRVIAAQQRPDHATIARFVERHEDALAGLFGGGARAVRAGRAGAGRGGRDRRHEGARQRQPRREPRLRADRARDPRGGPGGRRRRGRASTGRRAATSCRRSWPARRGGASGCARPSASWTERREQEARPVPRSRPARLKEAKRRLDEQLFDRVPGQRGL